MPYLYTLFCNDDYKYFVGASNRIIADPLIHFKRENDDFAFLEDHPMTEVISCEKVQSLDQLDTKVLELMSLNGILNVRGGSYMTLSKDVITSLLNMDFAKQKKMCVLCTSKSHYTKNTTLIIQTMTVIMFLVFIVKVMMMTLHYQVRRKRKRKIKMMILI